MSLRLRALHRIRLLLAFVSVACAPRYEEISQEPPYCLRPAPGGAIHVERAQPAAGVLEGRLMPGASNVRAILAGPAGTRATAVVADSFSFQDVSSGRYELRLSHLGQASRVDTLDVPPEGLRLVIPFHEVSPMACGEGVRVYQKKPWWKIW